MKVVREGVRIIDNVTVTLEDVITGEKQIISTHNDELLYTLSALSQWIAGTNNTGYQPVYPPSKCALGSGADTPTEGDSGLFVAISGAIATMSYANANQPINGTTTFVFQFPAGLVTTTVTEALMSDVNGNGWFHTMFPTPFTPTSTQNITVQWQVTFS